MFNLDQAIAAWRQQMSAGGIKTRAILDELESHLRDDIEQQLRSGIAAQSAFENAAREIGQPYALKTEFAKVGATTWPLRGKIKRLVLGFLGWGDNISFPPLNDFTAGARATLDF